MHLRLLSLIPFSALVLLGIACSSPGNSGTTGGDPCQIGCDKVAALKCTADKPASCLTECQGVVADATKVGCGAQAKAYLDCAVQLTFACDSRGYANPVNPDACKPQNDTFEACSKTDAAPPPLDAPAGG